MNNFDGLKSVSIRAAFESQKLSVLKKTCISVLLCVAVASSFFDDMGVMKHIWIAGISGYLLLESYKRIILPKLSDTLVTNSNFKANSFVIVATYILSSCSGAGLMTACLNVLGISATCLLIAPFLPTLYFPALTAIGSLAMLYLSVSRLLHYIISIPIAVLLAAVSVYYFREAFKPKEENENNEEDIESTHMLTNTAGTVQFKFTFREFIKTLSALVATGIAGLVIVYWIMLSISPFWMRAARVSKYETLHRLPHDVNLRVREVSSLEDLEYYKSRLNSFPVVIKPSICTTSSRNVMKCENYRCLEKYLTKRIDEGPLGDGNNGDLGAWVIQEYAPAQEGVVFYYKLPYMSSGSIKNIGIREDSLKESVQMNSKGTKLTAQYWPGTFRTDFSPEYLKFFNDLAEKIPGYTGGRFDISLPSDKLDDPRGLAVFELNVFFLGCIEEKKANTVVAELLRLRTSLMQLYIGVVNIVAGYNFLNFWGIAAKVPELVFRAQMCGNHEHLFAKP